MGSSSENQAKLLVRAVVRIINNAQNANRTLNKREVKQILENLGKIEQIFSKETKTTNESLSGQVSKLVKRGATSLIVKAIVEWLTQN